MVSFTDLVSDLFRKYTSARKKIQTSKNNSSGIPGSWMIPGRSNHVHRLRSQILHRSIKKSLIYFENEKSQSELKSASENFIDLIFFIFIQFSMKIFEKFEIEKIRNFLFSIFFIFIEFSINIFEKIGNFSISKIFRCRFQIALTFFHFQKK